MKFQHSHLLLKLIVISLFFLLIEQFLFCYDSLPQGDLQTYLIKEKAATVNLAVRRAMIDAVEKSVARFMASDKLIKAIHLIDSYLRQNLDQYIQTHTIVSQERNNDLWDVEVRVIVDIKKLYSDLDEKGFIYKPRFFPKVLVIINETIDGEPSSNYYARKTIEGYIQNKGMDIVSSEEFKQVDFSKDKDKIVQYAQQMEAEIVILGDATANFKQEIDKSKKTNFLDPQSLYDTNLKLDIIRIDNDEIYLSKDSFASRADRNKEDAIRKSIEQSATNCSENLYEDYYLKWQKEVLNQIDYQFILNDTNEQDLSVFIDNLKRFDNEIKIYPRFFWHNTAILNVDYKGEKKTLKEFINNMKHPAYKITEPTNNILDFYQTF